MLFLVIFAWFHYVHVCFFTPITLFLFHDWHWFFMCSKIKEKDVLIQELSVIEMFNFILLVKINYLIIFNLSKYSPIFHRSMWRRRIQRQLGFLRVMSLGHLSTGRHIRSLHPLPTRQIDQKLGHHRANRLHW